MKKLKGLDFIQVFEAQKFHKATQMISQAKEENNYNMSFRTPGFIIPCSFQKAYASKKKSIYCFSPILSELCAVEFLNTFLLVACSKHHQLCSYCYEHKH